MLLIEKHLAITKDSRLGYDGHHRVTLTKPRLNLLEFTNFMLVPPPAITILITIIIIVNNEQPKGH